MHSLTQRTFAHHAIREDRLVGKSPQDSCSLQARKSGETVMSHCDSVRVTVGWTAISIAPFMSSTVLLSLCIIRQRAMNLLVKWNSGIGSFAKPWKASVGFVMSVRQHGTTRLPRDWFSLNLNIFPKSFEEIQASLKSNKNNGYFTWRPIYIFDHISLVYS